MVAHGPGRAAGAAAGERASLPSACSRLQHGTPCSRPPTPLFSACEARSRNSCADSPDWYVCVTHCGQQWDVSQASQRVFEGYSDCEQTQVQRNPIKGGCGACQRRSNVAAPPAPLRHLSLALPSLRASPPAPPLLRCAASYRSSAALATPLRRRLRYCAAPLSPQRCRSRAALSALLRRAVAPTPLLPCSAVSAPAQRRSCLKAVVPALPVRLRSVVAPAELPFLRSAVSAHAQCRCCRNVAVPAQRCRHPPASAPRRPPQQQRPQRGQGWVGGT